MNTTSRRRRRDSTVEPPDKTPPPDKTMQELGDEFSMIAGQCISQWALADELLFLLKLRW